MRAHPGQVFSFFSEQHGAYVACQITRTSPEGKEATLLTLDWCGNEAPTLETLASVKPLVEERFYFTSKIALVNAPNRIPGGWTLVGEMAPLNEDACQTFGAWWGERAVDEARWRCLPEDVRRRFKDALRGRTKLQIEGVLAEDGSAYAFSSRISTFSDSHDYRVPEGFDLLRLRALPALSKLALRRLHPNLSAFLAESPTIHELSLLAHGQADLDLSLSSLERIVLDAEGLKRLVLPATVTDLTLVGRITGPLSIDAEKEGRWITFSREGEVGDVVGLREAAGLALRAVGALDVREIADRFPRLRSLRVWGNPGTLSNTLAFSRLADLRELTLQDMFGFGPSDFPTPKDLPHLDTLWLTSVPADVAAAVKKSYRTVSSLDLAVRSPRKPEWLADNLDNPFRGWDGREEISVPIVKKASAAYRALATGTRKAIAERADAVDGIAAAVTELVRAYIETFNALDRRKPFIMTIEREEIIDALDRALAALPETCPREPLERLADELRDF